MTLDQLIIVPISIIAFLVLLTFIVFFHEFGHFSIARLLGVKVDTFSIGFGKPLLRWVDRKGTEWRIASLPFGGYVKFFGDLNAASQPDPQQIGEEDQEQAEEEAPKPVTTQFPTADKAALAGRLSEEERKVCFHFKPVWVRAAVVAAGPMANFILAIAIFAGLFMTFGKSTTLPIVGRVEVGTAAEEAGIQVGDRILSIDGRKVNYFQDIGPIIQLSSGEEIPITVERAGEEVTLTATPRRTERDDGLGNKQKTGFLGVGSQRGTGTFKRLSFVEAVPEATKRVASIIGSTLRFFRRLLVGKEAVDQLGGPVKMAKFAGQAATLGFSDLVPENIPFWERFRISLGTFINLAAVISVSIGFLNLLPIPVLDGGHLVYYGYEAVVGRPMGARIQAIGYQIGLVVLLSFMVFVTWNDVSGLLVSIFSSNG